MSGTLLLDPTTLYIINGASGSGDQDGNFVNQGQNSTIAFDAADTANNTISVGQLQSFGNRNLILQAKETLTVGDSVGNSATVSLPDLTSLTLTLAAGGGTGGSIGNIIFNTGSSISTGGGNVTITAGDTIATGNATIGDISTSGGDLTIDAQQAVTINGDINVGSGKVNIAANLSGTGTNNFNLASGSITTTSTSSSPNSGITIEVNTASGGSGNAILAGNITTGNGGRINISTNNSSSGGSITQTAGTLDVGNGRIDLAVPTTSASGIASSGTPLTTTAGTINLTTGTGGAFISNTGDLSLSSFDAATNSPLTVITTGTLSLPNASIATGTGDVKLESQGGSLSVSRSITTTTGNINLLGATGIALTNDLISTSGDISLTSTTGGFTQSNNSEINPGSGKISIDAGGGAAQFNQGTLTTTSSASDAITIHNASTVALGNITANSGTVILGKNQDITGSVTQNGGTTLLINTLLANTAGDITLTNTTNDFGTVGITHGNNVALLDINNLVLASSTINGTLDVTAGGNITQTGALSVTGTPTFTVTNPSSDILLADYANNFASNIVVTDNGNVRDLAIRNISTNAATPTLPNQLRNLTLQFDNASLTLPALTLSGNLTASAGGGR